MPRNNRHYRLTLGDAIAAHDGVLRNFGGRQGIHSLDLLESAIARPYNGHYRRIYSKAAALIESGATNHGFIDGNKRTTLVLFYLLLIKSGYSIRSEATFEENDIEHLILDVTTKFLTFEETERWLKARIYQMDFGT